MKKKLNIILLLLASGPVFSQQTFPVNGVNDDRERVYAFTHANIFTDYQTLSADATMIIRNGLVESVGKNTTIPAGAVIVDLQGKFIYPSFIDIYSDYGMPKISPEEDQRGPQFLSNKSGAYNWNQAVHPEVQAGELFDVMSEKVYWHKTKSKKTYRLDLKSQVLDSISVPASRHIFVVNKDQVWHSKGGNISISADFTSKSLKPLNVKQFDQKFLSEGLFVSGICKLDSRYLLVALAFKGYHLYDTHDDSLKKVSLLYQNKKVSIQNSENKSISCGAYGQSYLHSYEGLYVLLDPKKSFKHFAFNNDDQPESVESSNTIRGFSEDCYGNIWVATTNGFGVWNVKKRTAKMYFPKPGATNYRNYFSVRSIQVLDNKRILVCQSEKDIWIFNPKLGTFKPPNFQNLNIKKSELAEQL